MGLMHFLFVPHWQEMNSSEQKDFETIYAFALGLSVTSIEEDPFANDFEEGKFIDQI